jgi:hypothetical protein
VSTLDWPTVYRSEIMNPVDLSRNCRTYSRKPAYPSKAYQRALRRLRMRVIRMHSVDAIRSA